MRDYPAINNISEIHPVRVFGIIILVNHRLTFHIYIYIYNI